MLQQETSTVKSRNKGSSTMVVLSETTTCELRLHQQPHKGLGAAPSMGLVRRRMRAKGPPPQPQPQPSVPSGSEEDQIQHNQEEEEIHLLVAAYQDLVVVHLHHHRDFLFSKLQEVHQEMEETQEETQKEMKARLHKTLIKTPFNHADPSHMEIQTPVVMTEAGVVSNEPRLL